MSTEIDDLDFGEGEALDECTAPVGKHKKSSYLVLKDGVACVLLPMSNNPIPTRRRALVKQYPGNMAPALFLSKYWAERAIARTLKIASKINESVIFDWPKMRCLTEAGQWEVVTVRRWHERLHPRDRKARKKKTK